MELLRGGVNFYQFNIFFTVVLKYTFVFLAARLMMYSDYANILVLSALPRFVKEKHLRLMVLVMVILLSIYVYRQGILWSNAAAKRGLSVPHPYKSIL